MRLKTITYSAGFHTAVIIVAIIGLPFVTTHEISLPPPMMVELVTIAKKTQTIEQAKPKPPKIKKKPPKPKPPVEKPKPPKVEKPPKPKVSSGVKPKPEPKKDPVPPIEKPKDVKVKPEPKKEPKEEEIDFTSVLKNLALEEDEPETSDTKSSFAPLGMSITMSEQDAFRRQFEKCWSVPIGARDIETMSVEIRMDINPDRTLRQAVILDQSRYNRDSFFRAFADSALRAVNHPACSPFELPPAKYDTWKRTIVNFNPKDMF